MGREIAQVMAPAKALAALGLPPDTAVADIGAGSGYYAPRIAPKIPQGRVVSEIPPHQR